MKKPFVIAFSGGCFSGKTTTMLETKKALEERGLKVKLLSELAREKKIDSIDELRKDTEKYLKFQNDIICGKIEAEINCKNANCDVVLVDRAITDSLFYLTFYVDKANLNSRLSRMYYGLFSVVENHVRRAFSNIYDAVIEFAPLQKKCDDTVYRPKQIDTFKFIEHSIISTFNFKASQYGNAKMVFADLNNYSVSYVVNYVINNVYL